MLDMDFLWKEDIGPSTVISDVAVTNGVLDFRQVPGYHHTDLNKL